MQKNYNLLWHNAVRMSQNVNKIFSSLGIFSLKLGEKHTFCHCEHDPILVIKMDQKILSHLIRILTTGVMVSFFPSQFFPWGKNGLASAHSSPGEILSSHIYLCCLWIYSSKWNNVHDVTELAGIGKQTLMRRVTFVSRTMFRPKKKGLFRVTPRKILGRVHIGTFYLFFFCIFLNRTIVSL